MGVRSVIRPRMSGYWTTTALVSSPMLAMSRSPSLSAGLVCFDVHGMPPTEVVDRLLRRGIIATVTPYADALARVAPSILNTPAEVDRTLRAIRALA